MKICVVGAGYVGLSNALLLSKSNSINIVDNDSFKIDCINNSKSPLDEPFFQTYIKKYKKNIFATSSLSLGIKNSSITIICLPTNYDEQKNKFDTSVVKKIIKEIASENYNGCIVIRSTVPIGFTEKIQKKFKDLRIFFFPEFLREGSAMRDSLYPSRIICGSHENKAKIFLKLMIDGASKKKINYLITSPSEAEAIKLFSNTYLAMRVSFFNELDTFAMKKNMSAKLLINGISLDKRISNFYNNPSFGYGGYCLPKDTKQLAYNFKDIPNQIIDATVQANETRKNFIVQHILKQKFSVIGVYRLAMKSNSRNWRNSSVIDVILRLKAHNVKIKIYEPLFNSNSFEGIAVVKDFNEFTKSCDLIIANRTSKELEESKSKIFSRDIFFTDK